MQQIFPLKSTIAQLKESMLKKQQELFKLECQNKPKLRSFMMFKDFGKQPPHVGKPLSFLERRIVSKLRLGVLPLRIETGRYLRPLVPEHQRTCYCTSGQVESQYYVLFQCQMYRNLREAWLNKLVKPENFDNLTPQEKLKTVLNMSENVKHTAQFLLSLMDQRRLLNTMY